MNGNGSIWSIPGLIEALTKCISNKLSARQTAPVISQLVGKPVSRNACIGAAKRRGMPFRSDDSGQYDRKLKNSPSGLAPTLPNGFIYKVSVSHIEIIDKQPDFLGLTILDLPENGCRYPAGEQVPYLFCGSPQWNESSYCQFHHRVCNTGIPQHNPKPFKSVFRG